MAKIFLYLSLAVIVATAALGFLTKGRVESVKVELNTAKANEKVAQSSLAKAKTDLSKANEDLTAANKTVEDEKAKISDTETQLASAKDEASKANATIEDDKKQIADLTEKAKGAAPATAPVDSATTTQITDLTKQVDDLKKEVAESHQVADTLKQRDHESSERLAQAEQELVRYRLNGTRAGIKGRVVAVNQGWNFVVVDVGDRRGAALNVPLLVTRSGQQIARLRITSVEPSTSIADVVPGSITRGATVLPGDTVIFAGRQPGPNDQPAAAPNVPPGAPAPAAAAQAQNL